MKNFTLIFLIISLFTFSAYSQKTKLTKSTKPTTSDKKNECYAYVDAVKTYERVAEKGYKSADMYKKLGNSCYFNSELDKAAKWYGELFAMTPPNLEPEYYYRYAQSLKSIGQNDKANEMLGLYNKISEIKDK